MTEFDFSRCAALVTELGLGDAAQISEIRPLTGGVASDIARAVVEGRTYCVKFALPRLKVEADWRAPVHRNRAEYDWLTVAGQVAPGSAPRLYGRSETLHGFAMEYLDGPGVRLWKSELLHAVPDVADATKVGEVLGRIHRAGAEPDFDRAPFHNRDDFWALRPEPYLVYTATRHPDLSARLNSLAQSLYDANHTLVHGDVSPKNILLRDGVPVLLDAECATMGDPCFDLAFCINHLVLKAIHRPVMADLLVASARALWQAYQPFVSWEPAPALDARVAALLPALMLARVDGKSPVEYLDSTAQDKVRALAIPAIRAPCASLGGFLDMIERETVT